MAACAASDFLRLGPALLPRPAASPFHGSDSAQVALRGEALRASAQLFAGQLGRRYCL